MEICKKNRVRGGSSWAGAIFRGVSDNNEYSRSMVKSVIARGQLESYGIETFASETEHILVYNNQIIFRISFDLVEEYRCKELNLFENEVEEQLKRIFDI